MTAQSKPFPDFENPPVVEVVLGVQFEPLTQLRTLYLARLWDQHFRDRFPQFEEHPALDSVTEQFGPARPFRLGLKLETLEGPPVPRYWFLNPAGSELIQVQQDRFIHNWRKTKPEDPYPRYGHIVDTFEREFAEFEAFVDAQGLGSIVPNQCEVTYVNDVVPGEGLHEFGELDRAVTVFHSDYSDDFLPQPEAVNLAIRYVIPPIETEPAGRLTVEVQPAVLRATKQAIYRITLTARGKPAASGVRGFLDLGHEWVVRGFASITTPAMHTAWGRRA